LIPRLSLSRLWLVLAVLLPVLGSLATPLSTVDLAYHVRVGEQILDTGRIPAVDDLTFTAAGQPWLDQQWLAQLVLGSIHRLGSWEALAVLRAVLVGVVFGLLILACRISGASNRIAAGLGLAAFVAAVATLALRPQLIGMALFAVTLAILAARRDRPQLLWLLPFIAAVWTNVHGSFVLAPLAVGVAMLGDLRAREASGRRIVLVAAATLAATLVSPFGLGTWTYAAGLTTNPLVTGRITEWQPTSLRSFSGIVFFASALLLAAYLARRPGRTPWLTLAWLGGLFVLGAYAERGVAWWPLGAAVVAAGLIAEDRRAAAEPALHERPPNRVNGLIAMALVAVAVLLLPWWRTADPVVGRRGLLLDAPALATAVRATSIPGDRLFVPQRWGSWFEWATPDRPVFVDSRVELFPVAVWDDATAVTVGLEDWVGVLDRWSIDVVVVDTATGGDLQSRMEAQPGWREAASDAEGTVFVRR
jgi:hypothetical protein